MRAQSKAPRVMGVAALAALVVSCFEQPVTESLYLKFLPGDAVVVGITVKLAAEDAFKGNPAARERIEALRRELQEGRDDWARRIASVEPALERIIWDRAEGNLQSLSRRIALEHAEDLTRLFSDTLIRAQITKREEEMELTLIPGPGSRASRSQREEFEERRKAWLESYSRYLREVSNLYAFLEEHPSRAAVCFVEVFAEQSDAAKREELGPPSPEEKALTEALRESMDEALALFSLPDESPCSLEELSRLVYDPFPAPLTVQLPGPILQNEGFVDEGDQILKIPELGLWAALGALKDRWISPDPLLLRYRLEVSKQPLDFAALVSAKRSAAVPPSAAEIQQILEEHLSPAQIYRVRWSTRDLEEPDAREGVEQLWQIPKPPGD